MNPHNQTPRDSDILAGHVMSGAKEAWGVAKFFLLFVAVAWLAVCAFIVYFVAMVVFTHVTREPSAPEPAVTYSAPAPLAPKVAIEAPRPAAVEKEELPEGTEIEVQGDYEIYRLPGESVFRMRPR